MPTIAGSAGSLAGGQPRQRLFVIAADGRPLDDYYVRLSAYLKNLARADGVARTLYVAASDEETIGERFQSDGASLTDVCDHPLDPSVDVAVAPFSHFRGLFFAAGGVHALPQSLLPSSSLSDMRPRDLFYFDEAISYIPDEYLSFLRLVEFLFAQDLDLVVGSSTLSSTFIADLAFLETIALADPLDEAPRSIRLIRSEPENFSGRALAVAAEAGARARVALCTADSQEAETLYQHSAPNRHQYICRYHSGMANAERIDCYERLRARDRDTAGYLVFSDGPAWEASDLDADLVITPVCSPESLVLRAGRCNRKGERSQGRVIVIGDGYPSRARPLSQDRCKAYLEALIAAQSEQPFRSQHWKAFVG